LHSQGVCQQLKTCLGCTSLPGCACRQNIHGGDALQAFCKLAGIQVSPLQDISPEQLAAAPFQRYTPLLCNIQVTLAALLV
jgi:hypothetical protein